MSSVDMTKTVAMIWVVQDGDKLTLAVDPVQNVIPYDRQMLAAALHQLGDQLDDLSESMES